MVARHEWLDEVIEAADGPGDLLVLCRTRATVRAVYRALLDSRPDGGPAGWAGLEVTTLPGLLARVSPRRLFPPDEPEADALRAEHPWADTLAERPRLRRLLRRHVNRARACELAGRSLGGLRPEVLDLAETRWGLDEMLEGARRVLRGEAVEPGTTVLAVGYGGGAARLAGAVSPLDRALLGALDAQHIGSALPTEGSVGTIRGFKLADTAAEARTVALYATKRPRAVTVVLVPDGVAEERIRAALRRNGVGVALDAATPLHRHSLAALLASLVPAFASGGAEPVSIAALRRLLTSSVLSSGPPKGGIESVPGGDEPRAGARKVKELLSSCGLTRATLDQWTEALARSEADLESRRLDAQDADSESVAAWRVAAARVVRARVQVVRDHANGRRTLGELAGCLAGLGLSDPGRDRVGRAIIAALWDSASQPCDEVALGEILRRTVTSGRVERGVQILRYGDYDGRPCELLLLVGVHDKGLARPPRPDPLLRESDLRVLDLPTPREAVLERLGIARWAAACADKAIALCPETGPDGRPVGLPVGLDLRLDSRLARESHGLSFDLPQKGDRAALVATEAGEIDAAARQVDCDWIRHGALFDEPSIVVFDKKRDHLGAYLDALEGRIPADLAPWLGRVGPYPGRDGGLPQGFTLSATRLGALTQCPFRAFAQHVVGLKKQEEVSEDLDPREVGGALHAALETAMPGVRWVVPDLAVEQARQELLSRLLAATEPAFAEAVARRPPMSDSALLGASRRGLIARWERHWRAYVDRRIVSVSEANNQVAAQAAAAPEVEAALRDLVDSLFPEGGRNATVRKQMSRGLERALIATKGDPDRLREAARIAREGVGGKKNGLLVRQHGFKSRWGHQPP